MKRLFVTELDTQLGRRVTEKFGLTKEFEIIGTVRSLDLQPRSPSTAVTPDSDGGESSAVAQRAQPDNLSQVLPHVQEVVPRYTDDAVEFKRRVLEADIIICPLRDSILEAEAALKMLAHTPFETEKTFVLVSSMLTWANTHAAQKAEELAEKRRERQALIDAGEEVPPEEEEPTEEEEKPTFGDDGYQKRVAHPRYQHWRDLEHLTKVANSETLHTNIICSGLTYGREMDHFFHSLFRAAWHFQPLPLLTSGSNIVPLIHVEDLANLVFKVGNSNDVIAQRYILGVDRGNCSLGGVVKAVNEHVGCGETYLVPPSQLPSIPFSEWLTTDLKTEPSVAFEIVEEAEWVAPDGFTAAIEKISEEYKKYRKVNPIRSVVLGPPLCGKSFLAKKIAEEYRIQHLTIRDTISAYETNVHTMKQHLEKLRSARREAKKLAALEEERKAKEAASTEGGAADGEPKPAADDNAADGAQDDDDAKEPTDASNNATPRGGPASGKKDSIADDVSDIDFDEALPTLGDGDEGVDEEGGEAGTNKDTAPAAAAVDPDEDEDEAIAKLKEEISVAQKVLSLQKKVSVKFHATPNPGEGADSGDGGNAEGEGAAEGEEGEGEVTHKDAVQDPFLRLRYIDEALAMMTRWRIQRKDCRNQGYILDGFPKTVRQAMMTFSAGELTLPEPEELANAEAPPEVEEGAMNAVEDKLLPEHVIVMHGKEPLLLSRAIEEPGKDITLEPPGHDSFANVLRRLTLYKANHTDVVRANRSVATWFKSIMTASENPAAVRTASVSEVDASRALTDLDGVMQSIRQFIGEPHFYRPTTIDILKKAEEETQEKEAARLVALRLEEEKAKAEEQRQSAIAREKEKHRRRFVSVEKEQKEAESVRTMPMQQYLMKFVVPALTGAIEQTVQLRPEDPIDSLAEKLFSFQARTQL